MPDKLRYATMFLTIEHQPLPKFIIANELKHAIEPLVQRNDIALLASFGIFRHKTSLDPAPLGYTDWVLETDNDGDLYTRVPAGTQEEIDRELNKKQLRWISSAEFIRRIPTDRWDAINQARLTNMTLQRLKDMLITGDPNNKGNINLDAEELLQGLDYVVSLGLITPEQKALLLT